MDKKVTFTLDGQTKTVDLSMSTSHKKTAHVLTASVVALAERFGIERLGFLTLTFKQHVTCAKEAQRRLNSLLTGVIKSRYSEYVGVFERMKSGRIHYHLLIVLDNDIRTGFSFAGIAEHDYSSANSHLRSEWAYWRKTAPAYGFGRTELLPVKSTSEAIARYVGKYIGKTIESRALLAAVKDTPHLDKGVRLVRYSNGARAGNTRFMFVSKGSRNWRHKVAVFAQIIETETGEECRTLDDLRRICGKRWAYRNRPFIDQLPDLPEA